MKLERKEKIESQTNKGETKEKKEETGKGKEFWEEFLAGSSLDKKRIAELASIFAGNQLGQSDLGISLLFLFLSLHYPNSFYKVDFDHDLLSSMGIDKAKERLLILKWINTAKEPKKGKGKGKGKGKEKEKEKAKGKSKEKSAQVKHLQELPPQEIMYYSVEADYEPLYYVIEVRIFFLLCFHSLLL